MHSLAVKVYKLYIKIKTYVFLALGITVKTSWESKHIFIEATSMCKANKVASAIAFIQNQEFLAHFFY